MEIFPFFVGAGRSGTTLVRAMFDSHPEMTIPGESGFIARFGRRRYETKSGFSSEAFLADLMQHRGFSRWRLPESDIRHALTSSQVTGFSDAVRRLYALQARTVDKRRYGDKTPTYVLHLPLLATLFPEARFVHVIRDGRDVALSHLDIKEWGPSSLEEAALDWKRRVTQGLVDGERLGPGRYRELRYEDLIEAPEDHLRKLCDFVGLDFDTAMLKYFERAVDVMAPEVHHHHHRHIYLPPTRKLRDWRLQMTPKDVVLFETLAGDLLTELGYERTTSQIGRRDRVEAGGRVLLMRGRLFAGRVQSLPRRLSRSRRGSQGHPHGRPVGEASLYRTEGRNQ